MKELLKKYYKAKEKADKLYSEIINTSDGFLYVTKLRCYGSIHWRTHKNEFCVQDLCDEYTGENGIVEVYTNNPNHTISSYGDVEYMTEQEILNMSKEDISMSNAICNWVARIA